MDGKENTLLGKYWYFRREDGKKVIFFEEATRISNSVSDILAVSKFDGEQSRQVFGAFLFGVLNALAHEMGNTPVDVQGAMIELSMSKLGYTANQAVEFCQYVIDCTDRESNPTTYAIIHRGMEGYYQYKENRVTNLLSNYDGILTALKNA